MLTIVVGPRKENIYTADGKTMRVYPLLIKVDGKFCYLNDREFSNIDDIELVVVRRYLFFMGLVVILTPELKIAIIDFLQRYHAKWNLEFCCYDFAASAQNVKYEERPKSWTEIWDVRRWVWRRRAGDVVFLQSSTKRHFHAAVYIGLGLYISVYGAGGDLEVSTLKDMKTSFEATEIFSVTPRR